MTRQGTAGPAGSRAALQAEEAGDRLSAAQGDAGVGARKSRFGLLLALLVLLAFVVREVYVLATIVDVPIRGDIREYVAYAWNLVHHHVFSLVPPQAEVPPPDAYRSPGYPWLIAICMWVLPHGDWYSLALQLQVLLGAMTVALVGLLARLWLPQWAALLAAGLLALWPHHVVASGTLLSEVLFGVTLIAALYLFEKGQSAASGAMFGFAFLVNPLIGLFPPALALVSWRHNPRKAAIFLGIFLLPVAAWSIRSTFLNENHTGRTSRFAANLVQGSWPVYHDAYRDSFTGNPIPKAILERINYEERLLAGQPAKGVALIRTRLAEHPAYYAAWYAWQKPWLLWAWDIQIGYGGPYFLEVRNSPLSRIMVLRWITNGYRIANPVLTVLMLLAIVITTVDAWRRSSPKAARHVALLAIYLTALHAVLQAEPRYANAYRGVEALLVATAIAWLVANIRHPLGLFQQERKNPGTHPNLASHT